MSPWTASLLRRMLDSSVSLAPGVATMHVADWLRSLGLEQYEPAFRENEIDDKVLPRLTAEDLKELGVTVVGHRRRLLDAIIALQGEPAATLGGSAPTRGDRPGSAPAGAERQGVGNPIIPHRRPSGDGPCHQVGRPAGPAT